MVLMFPDEVRPLVSQWWNVFIAMKTTFLFQCCGGVYRYIINVAAFLRWKLERCFGKDIFFSRDELSFLGTAYPINDELSMRLVFI